MKFCSHCGKEIADEAVVCPACGCSVENKNKEDKLSILSIIGFVFAILFPVVGLIISIIARNNAKSDGDIKSANFAKAGIIVSSVLIGLVVVIYIIVYAIAFAALGAVIAI